MFLAVFTSRHFYKMIGYFVGASALTLLFSLFMSAGGFLSGLLAAVLIGITALVFGLGSTIMLRGMLSLMQTGRIVQYLCFYVGSLLGVGLASWLIPAFVVGNAWLAALIVFGIAFGGATLTGEVPTKGRTWLPRRMPKQG